MSHPIRRLHDLAECCVFGKQSVDPFHCDPHHFGDSLSITEDCQLGRFVRLRRTNHLAESPKWCGYPFFRSYGARLPSSLTRFHSRALVYSTHPPVSVYGTGTLVYTGAFLDSCFNGSASAEASTSLPLRADRHFQSATHLYRNVTSELNHSRCRNIKPAVHRLRPSAST